MKGFLLIYLSVLLIASEQTSALILRKALKQKDIRPETKAPERELLVLKHYEDRRKDYEAAKCKPLSKPRDHPLPLYCHPKRTA